MTKSLRILVLDDYVDVAESLGELLELGGHTVALVHDGPSALAAYRANDYDLGFFDVKMPGMNGVECMIEVRRIKSEARIIMMSGFSDDGLVERALANGALGLLRKPFEFDDLQARLNEICKAPVPASRAA